MSSFQMNDEVDQFVQKKMLPITKQITMGAIFGYSSGYFSRKFADKVVYVVGGTFVLLQLMQYYGQDYIKINWNNIQRDLEKKLDLNEDGRFDLEDVRVLFKRFMRILTNQLPSSAGFAAAFLLGFRK